MASETTYPPAIEFVPGRLMAHGPDALINDIATRVETALGRSLPQMQVRVKNLSLSAEVPVSSSGQANELPTLANDVKHALAGMLPGKSKLANKQILHSVNAVFEPGTMTLVLGQPGSGKSALLKVLSGRFPMTKNVTLDGEITYNGVSRKDMTKRLPQFVTYVAQRDNHFPTLTVKETLEFAHECCGAELTEREEKHFTQGSEEENKLALDAARTMFRCYPEVVIQQLGLDNCQNTIVGNAMLRGVSGGERKRVTTGEMEFGNKYVSLFDEISTGLDSAATYDIVKTQRSMARKFRKTIVTALLQPSPEVFGLFDYVLILNDGHVMYHGPRDLVLGYFESLGFVCPPTRDIADFLMDLGTNQQSRYEVPSNFNGRLPRQPAEFARLFQESAIHGKMLDDVNAAYDPQLLSDAETHFQEVPEFFQTFWESVGTLMRREAKLILRNDSVIKGRVAMTLVVGLIFSTLFYQFKPTKVQVVLGTVFSAVVYFGFSQASQVPTFMNSRDIFYKQRGANFYRTSAYVLASSLSQLPLAIIETVVFGSLVYWLCGFVDKVGSYLIFELLLLATNLAFLAWFFFLSAISPNLHIAEPLSMVSVLFYILFAGFIITKDNIPDYFIWAYWFNPVSWCMRALAVNQYRTDVFDVCVKDGVDYCSTFGMKAGEYLMGVFKLQTEKEWLWYGIVYMAFSYIGFMILTAFILEYVRYESPEHVTVSHEELARQERTSTDSEMQEYSLAQTPREVTLMVGATTDERHVTPVTLAFKDLWYSVPNPKNPKEDLELLKGISGFALPGTITALMGSSGAGKTTLMDVIAGRKTGGKIRGQILLNGHEATDLAIRRSTGYCEQMDIHSEGTTIREALTFSAFLRQSADIPAAEKYASVEECLDLLDMHPIADQIVRGSSVEQMKRLTIGVELAAQPSVLFLDEPTSGLDARSAKVIMDGVRKVANTGRTIVCTIHQPSWEVFSVFDSLLLLKRGGQTVFFGELGQNATELVQYFESINGVAPLSKGYNPATWMLEVIGAGVGNTAGQDTDFVEIFNNSEKKAILDQTLNRDGVTRPAPGVPALEFGKKRAATESTQAMFLLKRFMNSYWRTSAYNLTRFAVFVMLAVIFGLSFLDLKYDTYRGINAGIGMVFVTTVFIGAVSFESVLPIAGDERGAYYRERASQTYNALWYFVGSTLAEIPYVFGSCLLFCSIFFPMVGFTGFWRFVLYWIHLSLHVLLQTYVGQFFIYALPNIEVAMIAGVIMNCVFFMFMGYNPPAQSIPSGYKWLYHLVPPKYSFAILSSLVFGECSDGGNGGELGCKPLRGDLPLDVPRGTTVKQYVESVFKIERDDLWTNFAVVIGYIVLVRVLSLIALRFVNHQKR